MSLIVSYSAASSVSSPSLNISSTSPNGSIGSLHVVSYCSPMFSAISLIFGITSPFLSIIGPTFCLTLLSPFAYEKKIFWLFLQAAIVLSSFCFLSLLWEASIFLSISILSYFSFSLNELFKIHLSNLVRLLIDILQSLGIRLFFPDGFPSFLGTCSYVILTQWSLKLFTASSFVFPTISYLQSVLYDFPKSFQSICLFGRSSMWNPYSGSSLFFFLCGLPSYPNRLELNVTR